MLLSRVKYSPLGIDLGSQLIKVVQLKRNQKEVSLHHYAIEETPSGSIVEGKVKNSERIAACVKKICSGNVFKGKRAVVSVGGENVFIKRMVLPEMDRKELEQAIRFELEKHVSLPPEDIIYDFEPVTELPGQRDVLLAAVSKKVVAGYMEVMDRVNLYPQAVEPEVTALARQFSYFLSTLRKEIQIDKQSLLLDVGAKTIHLILLHGAVLCFSRCLPWGGISCEDLVTVVQRNLDYYEYKTQGESPEVERLFVTGGKSEIKGLGEYITGQLEVEITFLNSADYLKNDRKNLHGLNKEGSLLLVGIGLALRGWENVWN